jgi:hypothetical protein
MAHQFNLALTKTSNILTTLHIILLASLFIGTVANAAVLNSPGLAQVRGKQNIDGVSSVHVFPNNGFAPFRIDPSNPKPTSLAPAESYPIKATKEVVPRQVHPSFSCPTTTGYSSCKGATNCLYVDPERCNGYIHCDANGVAWTGYCPMESMVWNDDKKICDYAKEKVDVFCHKEGTATTGEKVIFEAVAFPQYPKRGMYMGKPKSGKSAAPSSRQPLKKTTLLGLCVVGAAFVGVI